MRTTISLPDDVHQTVAALAANAGLTVSEVLTRLIRTAVPGPGTPRLTVSPITGLPVFVGGTPVTAEDVAALINDDEDAEIDA